LLAGFLGGLLALGAPAVAETVELRLARPSDLAELPLIVAEHNQLIERAAAAANLGAVPVRWLTPSKSDAIDALDAGEIDVAATADLAGFLVGWDERAGTPQEIRGLAAMARMPYLLLTRNRAVATIRDFTAKDRIAVPALKVSAPAVMLEMAAAQEWGAEHYDKLDPMTVARPDAVAAAALHSGRSEIDAHFARLPYSDDEQGDPAIHRVMDSFDIAGPHSIGAIVTTARFHDANPALCAAILAALTEADQFIQHSPGAAAEIYLSTVDRQDLAVEDLSDMLGDPDIAYVTAPAGIMRLADFMQRTGRLKHRPESWRELFFPEAHDLGGS